MADHIFSRAIFNKKNGFVKTIYGQGADWATSILFSSESGICFIQGALVYWRYGGENISSVASKNRSKMIEGHFQFIKWILFHFQYLNEKGIDRSRYVKIRDASYENLISIIKAHYKAVPLSKLFSFSLLLKKHLKLSWRAVFLNLIELNTINRNYLRKSK
jgi:hypothetical protein